METVKRGTGHGRRGHRTVTSQSDNASAVFYWPVRVYFEDTDAGGVVYHANYLRFMERARTEWLRSLGFEQDELRSRFGIQFVVTCAHVEYRRAVQFNAELIVGATVTKAGRASLNFAQQISLSAEDGSVVCEAEIKVACVDVKDLKPRPLPQEVVAELTK